MWRSIAIAALVYGYGHPKFDGYRPAGMDRALQAFYVEVNKAAATGRQALARFDDEAAVRYVKNYAGKVEDELKPAN
ncbi:MAG TPA: hypothetical protein VGX95_13600 [Xanthobacteraceae bacterium]|jgi:hypothetical protein|nr:hypothetical protein [Xanthobacteraceae bacterium]